jgi:hypothetical protein
MKAMDARFLGYNMPPYAAVQDELSMPVRLIEGLPCELCEPASAHCATAQVSEGEDQGKSHQTPAE